MNWVAPIKDADTLAAFKEELKKTDYKYYIMFEIGIGTGLQLQNILTLKVKDVLNKDKITVTYGTKNISTTFDFPESLQNIISEFCADRDPDSYLILGHVKSGKPVSREQAYRVFRAVGKKVGLNSIGEIGRASCRERV